MTDETKFSELQDLMALGQAFVRAIEESAQDRRPAAAVDLTTYVINRRGEKIPVLFDMSTARNEDLRSCPAYGPKLLAIDSPAITTEVVRRFCNGMTTREIDAETAAICIDRSSYHSDNEWLAARICVSSLHKRTPATLPEMVDAIVAAAPDRASIRYSDAPPTLSMVPSTCPATSVSGSSATRPLRVATSFARRAAASSPRSSTTS
jgi:hypothetical protein